MNIALVYMRKGFFSVYFKHHLQVYVTVYPSVHSELLEIIQNNVLFWICALLLISETIQMSICIRTFFFFYTAYFWNFFLKKGKNLYHVSLMAGKMLYFLT